MNKSNLKNFLVNPDLSIVDALEMIDNNTKGILFICDSDRKLLGCITDGDIRRGLLKTGDLNYKVIDFMNHNPKFLFDHERKNSIKMLNNTITALPIVNSFNIIIDIVFLSDEEIKEEKKKESSLKDVSVIIMSGGKGTRLYPYTKILPKPLIPIGDTPILERIINRFREFGVLNFYITVNYKKEMIKSYFNDLSPDYNICFIEENKPLGTAGSIQLIQDKFNLPVFITNCDTLINIDYDKLLNFHIKSGNDLTIVSALKNVIIPYGVLHSQENGLLKSLEEKPKLSYFINTGFYVLNPILIKKIPKNVIFHMTDLIEMLMKEGFQIGTYPISEDSFLDMGEFSEMERMEKKLNIT